MKCSSSPRLRSVAVVLLFLFIVWCSRWMPSGLKWSSVCYLFFQSNGRRKGHHKNHGRSAQSHENHQEDSRKEKNFVFQAKTVKQFSKHVYRWFEYKLHFCWHCRRLFVSRKPECVSSCLRQRNLSHVRTGGKSWMSVDLFLLCFSFFGKR